MKNLVSALVLLILVGGGLAFSQGQGGAQDKPDAQKRIDALEVDLGAQRQKCEALTADLEATKDQLAKALDYLEAQSKSASAMAATLDEAERLGFTFGINPDSRTTLLRGWREQLTAAQQALPVRATPKAATPKSEGSKPVAKKP